VARRGKMENNNWKKLRKKEEEMEWRMMKSK
jgi:hypothetical protein